MRIIRDIEFVAQDDRGASAAIGNFDGVHLGHQAVLKIARDEGMRIGAPLGVMTFEPHPREFFAPNAPPFRLMNAEAKANRMEKLGVERLYEVTFNQALANLSAEDFARRVIHDGLGLAHVVVGADFCFGKGRSGNASDLQAFGARFGFGVTVAQLVRGETGEVSSTNIRNALSDGRPGDAAKMLGHWHRIDGKVVKGFQRGREMGFPTANMSIAGLHPPKFGVYAVKVDVLSGPNAGHHDGAASIGVRPMFDGQEPNIETFLFDFSGDLYGAHISVALVEFLRPEEKYDTLDALVEQMKHDCQQARKILAST